MKITRFRKYVSWNIISFIGYSFMIVTLIYFGMFMLALSGTSVRPDIDQFFYNYIIKHVASPYINFYKFQLFLICLCLIASVYEHKYYLKTEQYGLRLFGNHEKGYCFIFVTGLAFNFLPLYIMFMVIISWLAKLL